MPLLAISDKIIYKVGYGKVSYPWSHGGFMSKQQFQHQGRVINHYARFALTCESRLKSTHQLKIVERQELDIAPITGRNYEPVDHHTRKWTAFTLLGCKLYRCSSLLFLETSHSRLYTGGNAIVSVITTGRRCITTWNNGLIQMQVYATPV